MLAALADAHRLTVATTGHDYPNLTNLVFLRRPCATNSRRVSHSVEAGSTDGDDGKPSCRPGGPIGAIDRDGMSGMTQSGCNKCAAGLMAMLGRGRQGGGD